MFNDYQNDEYFKELDKVKAEIQKERYKLQATKLESNRYSRQDSRFELFYENLDLTRERLPIPTLEKHLIKDESKEWVLGLGDLHYGATFKSKNNEYSREICKQRLNIVLSHLDKIIDDNNITELKIINVADTIQGILRLTDLQINDVPIVECVVEVSRLLAEFLNKISAMCKVKYYHISNSNHTQIRPLGSKASELASEDLENIIVNYIKDLLIDNSRVEVIFDTSKEYLDIDIFDFKCVALHGHTIKNPKEVIKDLSNLHRKFYSYAFLGHTHSSSEIIVGEEENNNMEVLTIPSFIGSDPYADSLCVGSKAMVKLYEFDKKYGHIGSKNIILN